MKSHINKYRQQPATVPGVHTGNLLRSVLKASGISPAELARRLDRSPNTVAAYFKNASMQTGLLMQVGAALGHNFFADIAALLPEEYRSEAADRQKTALQQVEAERDLLVKVLRE